MAGLDNTQAYARLDQLSTPQLEDILRADMALPQDDGEMALYIMEIIERRESGKSPEDLAAAGRAKEEFDRLYNTPEGVGQSLYPERPAAGGTPEASPEASGTKKPAPPGASRGSRRARRAGLIAAAVLAALLGVMTAAQAAGLGVFGRWNDKVFSLGTIRSTGVVNEDYDTGSPPPDEEEETGDTDNAETEWASIQDALDAHGVTEVAAPTWVPEGFSFDGVSALYQPDGSLLALVGGYIDEKYALNFSIESYDDEPQGQIMKTDTPVEIFEVNGITVYLIENSDISNSVTWATEHYEYFIGGVVDKSELLKMAQSAIENVKEGYR